MTRAIAGMLIAFGVAIGSSLAAAPPTRNLWLGVVQPDFALEPVAAFVDGKWWYDTEEDANHRQQMNRTIGAVPAQWLPPGKPLPNTWRARLFNGHSITLHTEGPLHLVGEVDHLAVKTDHSTPDPGALDPEMPAKGVAVSGDVDLHVFTKLPAGKRRDVLRFIGPAILETEHAAFKQFASSSHEDAESIATVTDRMIADTALDVERAESSVEDDGSVVYYIEGGKQYHTARECQPQTRVSATVLQDPTGSFHLVNVSAVPVCGLYISNAPLAILERGGSMCWLVTRHFEDGMDYVLMKPGHTSAVDPGPSDCDLK